MARLTGVPSKRTAIASWIQPITGSGSSARSAAGAKAAIERAKLPGSTFTRNSAVSTPIANMAAHLLGYVDVDEEGRSGLEGSYNAAVRGEPGEILLLVDAHGKSYEREQTVPQPGAT